MAKLARRHHSNLRRYRRARIRHFLFTLGPNRITGGRITRRHIAQGVAIRETEMASPLWPLAFDGLRIGHVSDFHLGELLPIDKALEVVRCLGDQQPDLVACTGDLVDLENTQARPLLEALGRLDPPMGTFLVLGNHDELHDGKELAQMATDSGLTVLRNEAIEINRQGSHLIVVGIDWARSAVRCAQHVDLACGEQTHLLLAHNPKAFLRATDLGIPLTLAGHTHGGQIAMWKRPNANLALTHRRGAGLFQSDGSMLYVTTGVGAWFPLRVNCPAEIAMLTIRHEAA
ncbi:MAG: metallophosphoesterase [Planctomycetota bacterium]|nr:metallophosphoesterase [Planctomycetota bacterium]